MKIKITVLSVKAYCDMRVFQVKILIISCISLGEPATSGTRHICMFEDVRIKKKVRQRIMKISWIVLSVSRWKIFVYNSWLEI